MKGQETEKSSPYFSVGNATVLNNLIKEEEEAGREEGETEKQEQQCSEFRNLALLSGSDLAGECKHQIKITSHTVEDRSPASPLPGAAHAQCEPLWSEVLSSIPQQKARVRKGLCLMYELWLAIVSHPRTSCRQNKNLL